MTAAAFARTSTQPSTEVIDLTDAEVAEVRRQWVLDRFAHAHERADDER